MAQLRITQTITGIKSNVGEQLTPGSDLVALLDALRALVHDSLELVADLEHAKAQNLVNVTMEVGDATPVAELEVEPSSSHSNGFLVFRIAVKVRNDLVWNHRNPDGPVSQFVQDIIMGLFGAVGELSDPQAFIDALGLAEAEVVLGSSIIMNDGDPLDGF